MAQLLEESEWFIEWTAPDAPVESQVVLVACQRDIARWRRSWAEVWEDPARRADVAERANAWSGQFLGISGLVRVVAQNPATA